MSKSTLGQVLDAFVNSRGPLTISQISRDLNVSQVQLEGMIQYWVRKGKLRESSSYSSCGTCGHSEDGCPFVLEMPHAYELVTNGDRIPLNVIGVPCQHKTN